MTVFAPGGFAGSPLLEAGAMARKFGCTAAAGCSHAPEHALGFGMLGCAPAAAAAAAELPLLCKVWEAATTATAEAAAAGGGERGGAGAAEDCPAGFEALAGGSFYATPAALKRLPLPQWERLRALLDGTAPSAAGAQAAQGGGNDDRHLESEALARMWPTLLLGKGFETPSPALAVGGGKC